MEEYSQLKPRKLIRSGWTIRGREIFGEECLRRVLTDGNQKRHECSSPRIEASIVAVQFGNDTAARFLN